MRNINTSAVRYFLFLTPEVQIVLYFTAGIDRNNDVFVPTKLAKVSAVETASQASHDVSDKNQSGTS